MTSLFMFNPLLIYIQVQNFFLIISDKLQQAKISKAIKSEVNRSYSQMNWSETIAMPNYSIPRTCEARAGRRT